MDIAISGHQFRDVGIPLLWGNRAVLADKKGRLSVINLSDHEARLELLADKPAPGVRYEPVAGGFKIWGPDNEPAFIFKNGDRTLTSINERLPEVQLSEREIRAGSISFSSNSVSGHGVGIHVTEDGIGMGGPLPPGLAKLKI